MPSCRYISAPGTEPSTHIRVASHNQNAYIKALSTRTHLITLLNMDDSIVDYLHDHFDVDSIMEDFGLNGWDYIKSLSIEEIDEEFEDYRL